MKTKNKQRPFIFLSTVITSWAFRAFQQKNSLVCISRTYYSVEAAIIILWEYNEY